MTEHSTGNYKMSDKEKSEPISQSKFAATIGVSRQYVNKVVLDHVDQDEWTITIFTDKRSAPMTVKIIKVDFFKNPQYLLEITKPFKTA